MVTSPPQMVLSICKVRQKNDTCGCRSISDGTVHRQNEANNDKLPNHNLMGTRCYGCIQFRMSFQVALSCCKVALSTAKWHLCDCDNMQKKTMTNLLDRPFGQLVLASVPLLIGGTCQFCTQVIGQCNRIVAACLCACSLLFLPVSSCGFRCAITAQGF